MVTSFYEVRGAGRGRGIIVWLQGHIISNLQQYNKVNPLLPGKYRRVNF